ncbi:hypothetical protein ACLOJK_011287 [Asimina triloba]
MGMQFNAYLEEQEHNPDIDRNETLGRGLSGHSSVDHNGSLSNRVLVLMSISEDHHIALPLRSKKNWRIDAVKLEQAVRYNQFQLLMVNLGDTGLPFLVTLNPPDTPQNNLLKWTTSHPFPSVAASKAMHELDGIQGKRRLWLWLPRGWTEEVLKGSGSTAIRPRVVLHHLHNLKGSGSKAIYPRVVIHHLYNLKGSGSEAICPRAGLAASHGVLGKNCILLRNIKHMVPSLMETGARLVVTRFLGRFISVGCLMSVSQILLEEGGTIFEFAGSKKKSCLKSVIKVHHPSFYWKVATQADLGLADAYINGDFSFVDKEYGLLNMFMIFVANRDMNALNYSNKRQNTLTQARRNISHHYDLVRYKFGNPLSNDLFALFLDETMTYSCAVFKSEHEDLKVAQLRKISLLIEKARINCRHEILEIGCGWGSLAIEVVKRTGCKYTGITLSEEQLKYAQQRVNEAGLEDRIKFLHCDYRQLPSSQKFDRIISCEMLEAVGHEYMEEFFGCCESVLAEDGLLVLQFISIPDKRYDEYRRSSDFIKEYIFPGGCLPSLSRVTSAMASASRLWFTMTRTLGDYQICSCFCISRLKGADIPDLEQYYTELSGYREKDLHFRKIEREPPYLRKFGSWVLARKEIDYAYQILYSATMPDNYSAAKHRYYRQSIRGSM